MKQRNKSNLPTPGQIQTWEVFLFIYPSRIQRNWWNDFFDPERLVWSSLVQVHNFQMS